MAEDVSVKFGADTKNAEDGVHRVENELKGLRNTVQGMGSTFSNFAKLIAGVFSVNVAVGLVESLGDMGEKAERTSEMLGMTTEAVTALQYATIITGQGAEQMTSIMERLARSMDAAASGGKQQIAAFKEVGVAYRNADGSLRPLQDMLYDIADRFAGAKDGAEKTALAMELMGRSGAEAIPLLNRGSQGLRQFAEEGRKAGVVLTAELAAGMGETGDKIDNLKQSLAGLAIRIFEQLKPAIDAAVDGMTAFVQSMDSGKITTALNAILDVVIQVMTAIAEMAAFVQKVLNEVGTRAEYVQALGLKAFASGATAVMKQQIDQMNADTDEGLKRNIAMFGAWRAQVREIIGGGINSSGSPDERGQAPGGVPGSTGTTFVPPPAPLGAEQKAAQNAVQNAIDAVQRMSLSLQDQIATLGMGTAAATAYTEEHKVLAIAQLNNIQLTAKQQAEVKAYAAAAGQAAEKLEYMTAVQDAMRGIAQGITDAFMSWISGTSSLEYALAKMVVQLAEAVIQALILNAILSAMGLTLPTTGLGAVFAPLFGGPKADGGPLQAGKWYMAGENGPEPIWGGGVGAFATGYGQENGAMNSDPTALAGAIAQALAPHFTRTAYASRQTSRTIEDLGRRIRSS